MAQLRLTLAALIALSALLAVPLATVARAQDPIPQPAGSGEVWDVTDDSSSDGWPPEGQDPWEPTAPEPPQQVQIVPIAPVRMVAGRNAKLRTDGKAAIPRGAPKSVRRLIAAGNAIVGKPYKWGGGHGRLIDKGYDCSGAVSYALIGGGMLDGVRVSGGFNRWGGAGKGRWVTTYSTKNHIYMEVAGLRLDTSPVGDWTGGKGPRWRPVIGRRTSFHVRHPIGY